MADKIVGQNERPRNDIDEKFNDQGDGSFARQVAVVSGDGASKTATVAAAGHTSAAVDLGSKRLGFIGTPATLGSGATHMGFEVSASGTTYRPLYDEYGARYLLPIGASRAVPVNLQYFAAARYVKVVFTDSAGATKTHTAERDVTLGLTA